MTKIRIKTLDDKRLEKMAGGFAYDGINRIIGTSDEIGTCFTCACESAYTNC